MTDSRHDNDSNEREPAPARSVDDTFIEDLSDTGTFTPLEPGTRINAEKVSDTNPYALMRRQHYDELPEPVGRIAMGSGEVRDILGDGGMARVYKIWNAKLEVYRAVKVVLPGQAENIRKRFETEALITAKLRHPNIVEIHDVGEYNGLPYIEMEYIEGWSLERLIATHGRLPPDVCASIGVCIAGALSYAHNHEVTLYGTEYHGIIHRDLKPANILVARDGRVKLSDFGIARPVSTSIHTVEGSLIGTAPYLSPEQIEGGDIDARTDIYSMGAVLYEAICGTKTFPQEILTAVLKKKSVNEYRALRSFGFPVHRELSRIITRCLQSRPRDRYPSAEVLLGEIQNCLNTLSRIPPGEIVKQYVRHPTELPAVHDAGRGRALRRAGAAAAVTIAVAAGALLWRGRSSGAPRQPPPVPAAVAVTAPADMPVAPVIAAQPTLPQEPSSRPTEQTAAIQPPAQKPAVTERRRQSAATTRAVAVTAPKASAIDTILGRYGVTDTLEAARRALAKGAFADALRALDALAETHAERTKILLLTAEAALGNGAYDRAAKALDGLAGVRDAHVDLLAGRLAERRGDSQRALALYGSALMKPSTVRAVADVRSDALFAVAQIRSARSRAQSSAELKQEAINAWLALKRHHADPGHPRFRIATEEMSKIQ